MQTEEEILLLYDIIEKHGSAEDLKKLLNSPIFNPITQLHQGRKELFMRVVAKYQRENDWENIYQICKDCLSTDDKNGQPNLLASDWVIWREFILAAGQLKGVNPELVAHPKSVLQLTDFLVSRKPCSICSSNL